MNLLIINLLRDATCCKQDLWTLISVELSLLVGYIRPLSWHTDSSKQLSFIKIKSGSKTNEILQTCHSMPYHCLAGQPKAWEIVNLSLCWTVSQSRANLLIIFICRFSQSKLFYSTTQHRNQLSRRRITLEIKVSNNNFEYE